MKRKTLTKLLLTGFMLASTSLSTYAAGHAPEHPAGNDGWVKKGNTWQYHKQGKPAKGWVKDKDAWYNLDNDGNMKTGWVKDGNTWYLLGDNGAMKTGWVKSGNTWYYLDSNGEMKVGWVKHGNAWYYLDSNGEMKIGWVKHGKTWYYLDSNGEMKVGWVKHGNAWYYLDSNGEMKTGWVKEGKTWYYLDDSGAMKTGWINDGQAWYFLEGNGAWNPNKVKEEDPIKTYNVPMKLAKPELTFRQGASVGWDLGSLMGMTADVPKHLVYFVDVNTNGFDVNKIGDYPIEFTLNYTDKGEHFTGKTTGVIHVVESANPVLTFKNGSTVTAYVGDTFNPADYVTATDKEDGDITSQVKAFDTNGNLITTLTQEGTINVKFLVKDSDSNITTVTGSLNVLPKQQ